MTRRLVIVTEIISPYRIPLFNCLAKKADIVPHVIFLSENDPVLRQWKVYKEEITFSYEVLPSWRMRAGRLSILLNRGVNRALRQASPDAILCGGYNYIASWEALMYARSRNIPFLLWSESNRYDARAGHALVEMLKAEFVRRCDAFVVPGRSAAEYLSTLKVPGEKIFTAPNAVDNELFSARARLARENATAARRRLNLPERYFLFVGRLVPEKGVFDLLSAYSQMDEGLRQQIGLVFVGDGPCRHELETRAAAVHPGMIRFPGFAQREELPDFYALAEILVLPTYTDTWGLVVNEAMACGLPAIVSQVAGCAPDLIKEHWNGLLIEPGNIPLLKSILASLVLQRELLATMGAHSLQHVANYSPEAWARGISETVNAIVHEHD